MQPVVEYVTVHITYAYAWVVQTRQIHESELLHNATSREVIWHKAARLSSNFKRAWICQQPCGIPTWIPKNQIVVLKRVRESCWGQWLSCPAIATPNVLNLPPGPLRCSEHLSDCDVAALVGSVELQSYQHTVFSCIANGVVQALNWQTPGSMNPFVIQRNTRVVAAATLLLQHVEDLRESQQELLIPFLGVCLCST